MSKWHIVSIAVLAVLTWQGYEVVQTKRQQRSVQAEIPPTPIAKSETDTPSSCVGKKLCITVYVAPWCGACRISQPTFKALNAYLPKHRDDVGFSVVVGGASPNEHLAEQKKLNPVQSVADDAGVILKSRGIKAFPTWIVHDSNGKEIVRKSGGMSLSEDAQIQMLLTRFLQI